MPTISFLTVSTFPRPLSFNFNPQSTYKRNERFPKLLRLFRLCLFGAINCFPELRYRVCCRFAEYIPSGVTPNRRAIERILDKDFQDVLRLSDLWPGCGPVSGGSPVGSLTGGGVHWRL